MLNEPWSDFRDRLRSLFRRGAIERDLDDDLRFHLEHETEKYVAHELEESSGSERFGRLLAAVMLAAVGASCAMGPRLPARAPSLEETRESAGGMLGREYPDWATNLAPVPGRVVGLLLPAASKWGRSLEWIGESIVAQPEAYAPFGPERVRTYELYVEGMGPRMLWFASSDPEAGIAFRSEMAVRTLDDQVRSFAAAAFTPGMENPWGLEAEAHIVGIEVSGGAGHARTSNFELVATGVELLDGRPGYPRSVTELLDGARATFDAFVERETPRVASVILELAATAVDSSGIPAQDVVSEAIFPYWDDDRRRLVVLFDRRVMRMTRYSIACRFVYEGMPAEMKSMAIRYGYGVELGQKLELDADGVLVSLRSFEPAPLRIPSNAPETTPEGRRFPPVCPGSPGARPG